MIKNAPGASFVLSVLAFSLAWVILRWRYSKTILFLRDQAEDYKERLGLVRADKTAYGRLTNQELNDSVSEFVAKVREFGNRADPPPDSSLVDNVRANALAAASTEEEKSEIYSQYSQRFSRLHAEWSNSRLVEFQRDYQTEAMVLREELLKRLPKETETTSRRSLYIMLAGIAPINGVASDLERLKLLLPIRKLRSSKVLASLGLSKRS